MYMYVFIVFIRDCTEDVTIYSSVCTCMCSLCSYVTVQRMLLSIPDCSSDCLTCTDASTCTLCDVGFFKHTDQACYGE